MTAFRRFIEWTVAGCEPVFVVADVIPSADYAPRSGDHFTEPAITPWTK
ncbi:hypothetical protein [Streptomyces sp. Act143]|nr:hypothetical protein [Streptomyces sp. Act143]